MQVESVRNKYATSYLIFYFLLSIAFATSLVDVYEKVLNIGTGNKTVIKPVSASKGVEAKRNGLKDLISKLLKFKK